MSNILEEKIHINKEQLIDYCLQSDFPGSSKWPANHPIWDCYLPGRMSPREAWSSKYVITKAVDNLFWILNKSITENKYQDFIDAHIKELNTCIIKDNKIISSSKRLLEMILARFTVAKIAPKVTALNKYTMYKIMEDSQLDFSSGVYAPMAGFGGIIEAAKIWFKKHNVAKKDDSYDYLIEAYDINKNFCDWYGWIQKDMLAEHMQTDKIVIVCPPFGNTFEHWKGTPDEFSDITFLEWYFLIKDFIDAPNYLIIGPEIKGKQNQKCGLFFKTNGIQLWTDDMYEKAIKNEKKNS